MDDVKRILQDKQFYLQLKSEQKEIIQNVLERKDSMAVLPTGFGKSMMCYVLPPLILEKVTTPRERIMADCGWFWSILWVIILLVFGWPIGFICAVFYCLLSPFAACCHGCNELVNLLERGVKLPLTCAQNMVSGKSMC